MDQVFAPGCALMLYKPELGARLLEFLRGAHGALPEHLTCCKHEPGLAAGTRVINVCAGCDRRYRELYPGITTISLWEVLAADPSFPFPDYGGAAMAVQDACPTRSEARVAEAVRALLARMNIVAVEPERTRAQAVCCGDSFYPALPLPAVHDLMRKRAAEMPCEDVVVYCVSCVKAMHIGGRRPRYLVDLLFGEPTGTGVYETEAWHAQVEAFAASH